MKKKAWITALAKEQTPVQKVMGLLQQYGLDGNGSFWTDDLKNMAWLSAQKPLLEMDVSSWILLGSAQDLASRTVRCGLSLLALTIQAKRGLHFPILLLNTQPQAPIENLPTPLRDCAIYATDLPGLGAKIAARAHAPAVRLEIDYHLDVHAAPLIGLWFEVGPSAGQSWPGALFGVDRGQIEYHAVGARGTLPERAVLEYPLKGLKMRLGDKDFTAWAAQNNLSERDSYFVRVQETPENILFSPFSAENEIDACTIQLC